LSTCSAEGVVLWALLQKKASRKQHKMMIVFIYRFY
jgi:hypothetical protein